MKQIKIRISEANLNAYKSLKAIKEALNKNLKAKEDAMIKAYQAEGRPMVGGFNDKEFWESKSEAIKFADNEFIKAFDACRTFNRNLGAKCLKKLHQLEMAGMI